MEQEQEQKELRIKILKSKLCALVPELTQLNHEYQLLAERMAVIAVQRNELRRKYEALDRELAAVDGRHKIVKPHLPRTASRSTPSKEQISSEQISSIIENMDTDALNAMLAKIRTTMKGDQS